MSMAIRWPSTIWIRSRLFFSFLKQKPPFEHAQLKRRLFFAISAQFCLRFGFKSRFIDNRALMDPFPD